MSPFPSLPPQRATCTPAFWAHAPKTSALRPERTSLPKVREIPGRCEPDCQQILPLISQGTRCFVSHGLQVLRMIGGRCGGGRIRCRARRAPDPDAVEPVEQIAIRIRALETSTLGADPRSAHPDCSAPAGSPPGKSSLPRYRSSSAECITRRRLCLYTYVPMSRPRSAPAS